MYTTSIAEGLLLLKNEKKRTEKFKQCIAICIGNVIRSELTREK